MSLQTQKEKAEKAVAAWKHPIGTPVVVKRDNGQELTTKTRSGAELLGGHSAVIWLDGISGCYALERVSLAPVSEPSKWQHLKPFLQHMEARLDAKVAERGPGETWMQASGYELFAELDRKMAKARVLVVDGASAAEVGAALADVGNLAAMAYQRLGGEQATPRVPGAGGRCDP
ncbi:hypothetical protein [Myxococcus sp. CA040A]|uniref:hypothetical protein n=1 Tax=Myxococcus sp. CA040A TaxID=2741738 RepID=UPI001C2D849D|nr:hypothetical protein [Myxococcus sp. CA040A]